MSTPLSFLSCSLTGCLLFLCSSANSQSLPTASPFPTPAFPVPPPNAAPSVSVPRLTPAPGPASTAFSPLYAQQLIPTVQVWRSSSLTPELPIRHGRNLSPVLIAPSESVVVRLQFGPQAVRKTVIVTPGAGVSVNPSQQVFVLSSTADCAVSVSLGQGYLHGAVRFYCEGLITNLPLGRDVATAPVSGSPIPGGIR